MCDLYIIIINTILLYIYCVIIIFDLIAGCGVIVGHNDILPCAAPFNIKMDSIL